MTGLHVCVYLKNVGQRDSARRAMANVCQLQVDSMVLGLGATNVEPVSDPEGSCPSKMYNIWHSCENEQLLGLSMEIVSFN